MGLNQLEWHKHAGGWVARIALNGDADSKSTAYRRYAHVNIYDWSMKRGRSQIPVQFQFYKQGYDVTWHDDIDSAKLHVEAIFALDDDNTDSLTHWR
jgi:hypothetical protein